MVDEKVIKITNDDQFITPILKLNNNSTSLSWMLKNSFSSACYSIYNFF